MSTLLSETPTKSDKHEMHYRIILLIEELKNAMIPPIKIQSYIKSKIDRDLTIQLVDNEILAEAIATKHDGMWHRCNDTYFIWF